MYVCVCIIYFITVDTKERCKLCGGSEDSFSQKEYKDWVSTYVHIKLHNACIASYLCSYVPVKICFYCIPPLISSVNASINH